MCDCYHHKCSLCEELLPIHLEDYDTERDEIEVFCNQHIPEKDVRVFTLVAENPDQDEGYREGNRIAIRYLTTNAKEHAEGNCPNTIANYTHIDI